MIPENNDNNIQENNKKKEKNYVIKLKILHAKRFCDLIESIKDITDQVNWYFNKENGIDCQGVDGSQISMIHFHLNKEYFDLYKWNKNNEEIKTFVIGVSMNQLSQMVKEWK